METMKFRLQVNPKKIRKGFSNKLLNSLYLKTIWGRLGRLSLDTSTLIDYDYKEGIQTQHLMLLKHLWSPLVAFGHFSRAYGEFTVVAQGSHGQNPSMFYCSLYSCSLQTPSHCRLTLTKHPPSIPTILLKPLILNSPLNDCTHDKMEMFLIWKTIHHLLNWPNWLTHPLLSVIGFFCLTRGTGMGRSGFISGLLNSISPVVSRFFAIKHRNKVNSHTSWAKCHHVTVVNISLPLLLDWDHIPVTVGLSFGWALFTFPVEQSIPTSSSCTHPEVSFSGRLSRGRVEASWKNGWSSDRRTSPPSSSLFP